jgi:hypothetical protein
VTIIRADAYLEHGYTNQSYDGNNFQYHRPDHLADLPRSGAQDHGILWDCPAHCGDSSQSSHRRILPLEGNRRPW